MKKCINCNKKVHSSRNKFCSQSCAATFNNKKRKIYKTKEEWKQIEDFYEQGNSMKSCLKKFSLSYDVWLRAQKEGLISIKRRYQKIPLEKLLKENVNYSSNRLKKRLIESNLKNERCEICGLLPRWNGKKLILQIDHINGEKTDNRLENLRILCPNCHSQTETWGRRQRML